ncbi:hypothetical protein TRICI_004123 [Trichomonascus ciferrii]|uniref:Aminotransferase class I/classII domain-containing protein n=1 Tax=Trichomonascus ciferrii TaxID=44093 RepID=A0A642V304_9ASCO|nr:hypothetical protein TRICI_004123 [Trichomonascus ciferrii]
MHWDSQHAADLFSGRRAGNTYSRVVNPTNEVVEKRIAALENGVSAVVVSSGQAAQFLAIAAIARSGTNVVSSPYLFGGTYGQFRTFEGFGIEIRFAESNSPEDYAKRIDGNTRAVFLESMGNPNCDIPDFEAIAKIAHDNGVPVIVDNTFGASGYLVRPFDHNADIVVESTTKWIGGHGTTIGGVIVDSTRFIWSKYPEKFTQLMAMEEKNPKCKGNNTAFPAQLRRLLSDLGPSMNPFGSFLFLQGLETLSLRVDRHCDNSLKLAKYLEAHPKVSDVFYPGLASHPDHHLAKKYYKRGFGAVLTFEPKPEGDEDRGCKVVDNLKLASHLVNVGDMKTLVALPFYTTHHILTEQEKKNCRVTPGLIRVSVGCEFIDDIIADFDQALEKAYK